MSRVSFDPKFAARSKAAVDKRSRCWECGRKLMTKKGGGYIFKIKKDPIGDEHRVHLTCVDF